MIPTTKQIDHYVRGENLAQLSVDTEAKAIGGLTNSSLFCLDNATALFIVIKQASHSFTLPYRRLM
jgi:hypothetical protein